MRDDVLRGTLCSGSQHYQRPDYLTTQLISADNNGHWGSWALLSASNSTIRIDNVGFHLMFLDPNYAFLVNS